MKERHSLQSKAGRRELRAHFLKIHYVQPGLCICECACCFQTLKTDLKTSSEYSPLAFICNVIFRLHLDYSPSISHESSASKQQNQIRLPSLASLPLHIAPHIVSSHARAKHAAIEPECLANAITTLANRCLICSVSDPQGSCPLLIHLELRRNTITFPKWLTTTEL